MIPIPTPPRIRYLALALHTFAVYFIAIRFAPWMVFHWFRWGMPALGLSTTTLATDWYLQHMVLVTTIPALLAGYLTVRQSFTLAQFSWAIPTLVLLFKMIQFHPQDSVLTMHRMSSLRYFFEIQQVMPTFTNLTGTDPVRVLAQMTVTAPFYAGVAYAAGALVAKFRILQKLFSFESQPIPRFYGASREVQHPRRGACKP